MSEVRDRLFPLLNLPSLQIPEKALCHEALNIFGGEQSIHDYVDTIAIARVKSGACDGVYSYDRDLDKVSGTNRVEPYMRADEHALLLSMNLILGDRSSRR
jgi:hypothetical protein